MKPYVFNAAGRDTEGPTTYFVKQFEGNKKIWRIINKMENILINTADNLKMEDFKSY